MKVKFSIAECSFYVSGSNLFCIFYVKTIQQINNAGTNKGFRPLLQFSDEDIKQVYVTNNFLFKNFVPHCPALSVLTLETEM